jgi:predicted MFS family arabinose efflux permease
LDAADTRAFHLLTVRMPDDERVPAIEKKIVWLVALVQFVNIVDFMMVMPLGPDLAGALSFDVARLGFIGGAYTASAAVAGILGAPLLDRLPRRVALCAAMVGLGAGTLLGGLATGFTSLVAARIVAGAFGGPATSVALALIADHIPAQRRGRAMGAVFGAFSAASVLGVPAGLELARLGSWRMPFFALGVLGLLMTGLVFALLPKAEGVRATRTSLSALLKRPAVIVASTGFFCLNFSGFILIPNVSGFLQKNLHYPRDGLSQLYLIGGVVSFFGLRAAGYVVDKMSAVPVVMSATSMFIGVLYVGFYSSEQVFPVWVIFIFFMLSASVRNVGLQTLASRIAAPAERAAFGSWQSAVQHIASAMGASLSTLMLAEVDGKIVGMQAVIAVAVAFSIVVPVMVMVLSAQLGKPSTT